MKKLLVLAMVLSISVLAMAQKGKVSSASGYRSSGNLEKAWEAISLATDEANPKAAKSLPWAKTWVVKGDILLSIAESKDEKVLALAKDPLIEALACYEKANKIDPEKGLKLTVQNLMTLTNRLTNKGVESYGKEDFASATKYFMQTLQSGELQNIVLETSKIDTAIIFNAAISASKADLNDKAIELYKETMSHGYQVDICLSELIATYEKMGQVDKSIEIMKNAVNTTTSNDLKVFAIRKLINYYLEKGQNEEALEFLDKALESDPNNPQFLVTKGSAYNEMKRHDEAIVYFEKTIEQDPTSVEANYNLGTIYYNKGVTVSNESYDIPQNETAKFDAKKAEADELFKQSVPYLEKAYELEPKETMILETLKNIYYRLVMMDKYEAADKELKSK